MSKITQRVNELPSYGLGLPSYTPEMIQKIENNLIAHMVKKTDEQLMEFFDPYLRKTGIKGEITKGKLKWRGIKMTVKSDIYSSVFQLVQRGETISPEFKANFRINQNSINIK
jgi:hypothetical protein